MFLNNNLFINGLKCLRKALPVLAGLLIYCNVSHATSFDCTKASTYIEKTICGNAQLSKLDSELDVAYHLAMSDLNPTRKPILVAEQRTWISDVRDKCEDTDCLSREYSKRLRTLTLVKTRLSDAQYVVEKSAIEAQVSIFQEQLKKAGISSSLTECSRVVRLRYGSDGGLVSRESLASPSSGAACKLNNKFVLICSNPILNDLTIKFEYAGSGDRVADFTEKNCPFNG